MSDSDERPVSIELPLHRWRELVNTTTPGHRVDDILGEIESRLPLPKPHRIGAVIEARRHGEASTQIYVRVYPDTLGYDAWRHADQDGKWENSRTLEVVRVLSPGVDL